MYGERQADGSMKWREGLNLRAKQYSEEELLEHYGELNNWDILAYQRLSAEFCVRWILDAEEWGVRMPYEEACIVDADVLNRQTHLTDEDLYMAREKLAPLKPNPPFPTRDDVLH